MTFVVRSVYNPPMQNLPVCRAAKRRRYLCIALSVVAFFSAAPGAVADDRPVIGTRETEMYPDFLLPSLDGDLQRFSDYRGKKILLFHFASW